MLINKVIWLLTWLEFRHLCIPMTPWKWVQCCPGLANSNPYPYPCIPVHTRTHVMPYSFVYGFTLARHTLEFFTPQAVAHGSSWGCCGGDSGSGTGGHCCCPLSRCPYPCHSLFPPCEQLLAVAVGGAVVVVVVVGGGGHCHCLCKLKPVNNGS